MKRTFLLSTLAFGLWTLVFGLLTPSTTEAYWFRLSGALKPSKIPAASMCLPKTCAMAGKNCGTIDDGCGGTLTCGTCSGFATCGGSGTANVCGETCNRYAYVAERRDGIEDVFSGGACVAEAQNLTNSGVALDYAHLTAGRGAPNVAFQYDLPEDAPGGSNDAPLMNVMDLIRESWNLMSGDYYHYAPQAVAWDASGRMAVFAREDDGAYSLRLNDGPYYAGTEARLLTRFGMVPAQDIEWVPSPDGAHSRYLIVNFGNIPTALPLYVIDTEASDIQPVSLEEEISEGPAHAMFGAQPALDNEGDRMFFVRRGRILACELDLSRMDDASPRAFCTDSRELSRLRELEGEMTSPTVSQDGQWLYLSMKTGGSHNGDLYRTRLDRQFLQPLTLTPDIDEKEIAALPSWVKLEARTSVSATMAPIRQETQYRAVTTYQTTYQTVATTKKP